ncbi:MAG TPA: glycosyltransferase [Candidatus Sulfotelmatobacter sp.]|jgi:glycosyltransferase involved in cell wall biosynthesis|nr:glycosyltransferase [Candidatus Sulfotelmatobacter sp.]
MSQSSTSIGCVSAIVPARNEESVVAACVESLAVQKEIAEIFVIDDQSSDRTAEIVRSLSAQKPNVRLLEATELPPGWVGKNNAVWIGTKEARGEWLLFTDADAVHAPDSAAKALAIASENDAALVSFSPKQEMQTWYEKAVVPYVFTRLNSRFQFADVNDLKNTAAAANGQFILIRRDVYDAVGGHASVASEILEDVALATKVKAAGYRIWFGSGKGIVRVRMYRTFAAMWEGWKKNLYSLMGEKPRAAKAEVALALLPILLTLLAAVGVAGFTGSILLATIVISMGLLGILIAYDAELESSGFSPRLLVYGIPGRILFAAVLWASFRSHRRGRLEWKGRAYPAGTPRASKG